MEQSKELWRNSILLIDSTVGQAIANLDKTSVKIIMIANNEGIFQGTVSDGDIRRGLLKGLNLNSPINDIVHRNAFVAPPELSRDLVINLMVANKVQQIPIVDNSNHIVGLHLWDSITIRPSRDSLMVIMAGGMGKRLRPYTEKCPKPLLRIGDKPILEHIINRAKLAGFNRFLISIYYLGEMIENYFGNGEKFDVQINYLREKSPLGTAGALSLINPKPGSSLVITNGDVITDIGYGDFLDFHDSHKGIATMAVRPHEWQIPFGVVQIKGIDIIGFDEKPIIRNHINAGVYALNPEALNFLHYNLYCDMPTLFSQLQEKSFKTIAYPMHEPWLDIGRPEDLNGANLNSAFI